MRHISPIQDQVLIRQDPCKSQTSSGLHLAPGTETWNNTGVVIAVGPGRFDASGERVVLDVRVGDRVVFTRRPGSALVPDRREADLFDENGWLDLLMLREADIVGVLEDYAT